MKQILRPIVSLTIICLVITAALAVTNQATAPVIESAKAAREETARQAVLPDAESFTKLTLSDLPSTIDGVWCADNGVGYVITMTAKGYGGDMDLICGIHSDGTISACRTLSHSETSGVGSKTAEEPFYSQFTGQDESLSGVQAISGATISSKAYIGAVQDAFTACKAAEEAAS